MKLAVNWKVMSWVAILVVVALVYGWRYIYIPRTTKARAKTAKVALPVTQPARVVTEGEERQAPEERTADAPAAAPNCLKNGNFADGLEKWALWREARKHPEAVQAVEVGAHPSIAAAVRIENPWAELIGVQQLVSVSSGAVYRLSGQARSTAATDASIIFGGRIGFYLPPQKGREIVWMSEYNKWWRKELVFTNDVDGQATVYLRWTMGSTDSSWQYCGWNIDDVEVWGLGGGHTGHVVFHLRP